MSNETNLTLMDALKSGRKFRQHGFPCHPFLYGYEQVFSVSDITEHRWDLEPATVQPCRHGLEEFCIGFKEDGHIAFLGNKHGKLLTSVTNSQASRYIYFTICTKCGAST